MSGGYVLGIDYGSDSVRALLVDLTDGREVASSACDYPRWKKGLFCAPAENRFRQHPLDYLESLERIIPACLQAAGAGASKYVRAIGIDTTGSTPIAVDRDGTALALKPEFSENPNAMFVLWKDHTALAEAERINECARNWGGTDFTKYSGGAYSCEWFWAKILHILRNDQQISQAAFSWVEHCDWLPALLTGNTDPLTLKRSRCAAGHKAMWHSEWDGLPPEEFLTTVDRRLAGLREKLFSQTFTVDVNAGGLCAEWAKRLCLPEGIPVTTGALDAHIGALGAKIGPRTITKVIGTSTCDMAVVSTEELGDKLISGICGQVDGSIIPGYTGLEAGQSAFGDLYSWYRQLLNWPVAAILSEDSELSATEKERLIKKINNLTLNKLNEAAAEIEPSASAPVALDWINGRRSPGADQSLKLALCGVSMGCDAPLIHRALVEATAFGNRRIIEHLEENGVAIDEIVAIGGIARKAPFVMQVCADVLGKPLAIASSEQCCALGAAICAAVVAGYYDNIEKAQEALGSEPEKTFNPDMSRHKIYNKLYRRYRELGDYVENKY